MSTQATEANKQDKAEKTEPAKILDSKALGGGQDKFRIVGKIDGASYEVGPYDTKDRAEAEARRLEPLSDGKPQVLVILTCSSVKDILKKYTPKVEPKAEEPAKEEQKPETAEGARQEQPKPADPQAAASPKEATGRPGIPTPQAQGGQGAAKPQAQTQK